MGELLFAVRRASPGLGLAMELIQRYGRRAHHEAVKLAVAGTNLGDRDGAERFTEAARELMKMGYHKFSEE